MAQVKCNVCGTNCVSCAGGKCRGCWFSVQQTEFSNNLLDVYTVDFAIDGITDYYTSVIKSANKLWYTQEDVIHMMKDYKPSMKPIVIKEEITETPRPTPQSSSELCEYEQWAMWARDQCKLCWVARFYGQNKQCIYKVKNK